MSKNSREFRPKKSLGQHFLKCRWVISTLIKAADITSSDTVLEIGPGKGILTKALAKYAKHVIAIEKDEWLADILKKDLVQKGFSNVTVIKGDALTILKSHFNRISYRLVSNIPYYLTSRLFRLLFERTRLPKIVVLTIQKEVAERICAKPPHMNLLALSVQAYGKAEIIKNVPAACFAPKPKVDSAIIRLSDISDKFFEETDLDPHLFFEVTRSAFSKKRKQLAGSLMSFFGSKENAKKILRELGIKPEVRPEELNIIQWERLISKIASSSQPFQSSPLFS